ncbi:family 1 glycosylhydrolase [Geminicoccaceae bacterium 1502E]|nr:family 1 glycosylhydrolase [Geminicoccaceae bacterium 1502E]
MTVYRFPRGFLWGAATAAHQVEGGNRLNDWWPAEEEGRLPHRSGEACRFWDLFERDLDLARRFGHNAHRLSLEWSRIEPEPGRFDEAALDHYAAILEAMAARGIEPVVTLHHFTSPLWFARRGGWLDHRNLAAFEAYAGKVAERLASKVRWWITVNEPTVLAKHGFVTGDWPPFRRGRWDLALRTIRAMGRGHVRARAALRAVRPDAMVSFAHSAPWIEPCNPGRAADRTAALARDFFLNRLPFRMLGGAPRHVLDYVAINYYTRMVVRWEGHGRAALFGRDCLDDHHGTGRRFASTGAEIHAPGLLQVLESYAPLGLPMMITENGLATDDEVLRTVGLREHLEALGQAVARGLDVRGYLHWTLMDNFEWALGTTVRFGLAANDSATQVRTPRPAMILLAEVARANAVAAAATQEAAAG